MEEAATEAATHLTTTSPPPKRSLLTRAARLPSSIMAPGAPRTVFFRRPGGRGGKGVGMVVDWGGEGGMWVHPVG